MTNCNNLDKNDEESSNIVNVHDPFFLWGILEHSNYALIKSIETLSDEDLSCLYWSCYFHKRSKVCEEILSKYELSRTANDAIKKLSEMTKTAGKNEPDLTQVPVPFLLPTSPNSLVEKLSDGSFIPSKGKPFKFTVISKDEKSKT